MIGDPEDPGGRAAVTVDDHQDVAVDGDAIREAAARALDALGVPAGASLSIAFVDPEAMADLKERALGVRAPTDVLSFPIDDPFDPSPGPVVLGDIVICPEVARAQARGLGRSLEDEMRHLLVHGVLHVLGHDHADPASELAMAREERTLLRALTKVAS